MTTANQFRTIATRTSSQSPYICFQCRRQASTAARRVTPYLQTLYPSRRNASSTPFSERIRNKIWGTTAPPGQDNPYGAPGSFEELREKKLAEKKKEGPPDEDLPAKSPAVVEPDQGDGESEEDKVTTWENMEVIGQANYGLAEWDETHPFEGYMEYKRVDNRDEIASIVHRALVEVMTLKKAGLPLVVRRNLFEATDDYDPDEDYEQYKHDIAQGATFGRSDDGETMLKLKDEELERTILDCVVPKESVAAEEIEQDEAHPEMDYLDEEQEATAEEEDKDTRGAVEQKELELGSEAPREPKGLESSTEEKAQLETLDLRPRTYVPLDGSWRSLSLADSEFKFAVLKRVMQLSGRRIPDPDIANIKDSKALFSHLLKKPKPKKLVQTLRTNEAAELPNVDVRGRRYTPIDKEREIGRWKVIAQELKARGLPVTGKGTTPIGSPVG